MNSELQLSEVIPSARAKVIEALEVVGCAAEGLSADEVWGLRNLLHWLDSRFEKHEDEKSQEFFDLSCSTSTVIAVLNVLNQARDHLLLHAANTVLGVAKTPNVGGTTKGACQRTGVRSGCLSF